MEPDFGPNDPADVARLREQVRALRDENEHLSRLATIRQRSTSLQAMRETSLIERAARDEATLRELHASTFWQVTAPLRLAARLVGGGLGRRAVAFAAEAGWRAAARRGLTVLRAGARRTFRQLAARRRRPAKVAVPAAIPAQPVTVEAAAILGPHVLIVAELSVPQCAKYRVWQKRELLEALGIGCTVTNWHDLPAARSALQVCSLVIFYRVPGTPGVLDLIAEAKRLGVAHWWEVDDLVFDEPLYIANGNVDGLAPEARDALLEGVRLYRRAMLACGRGIASTEHLASQMREAGVGETCVIENALDADTLAIAAALRGQHRVPPEDRPVRIIYGSGSRTHDMDFGRAAPALLRLMREHPSVWLCIVGELSLPAGMAEVAPRIERLGQTDYRGWLGLLAESDISLAPLAPTAFNDAKSNIKYLEAAILGVPSICSPRASFRSAIEDGTTAILAEDDEAWHAGLVRLAEDAPFRRRMGEAALRSVLERYAPPALARAQVAPLIATAGTRRLGRLRVMVVSAAFPPDSGDEAGAVAEEMARRMHARDDAEVVVFTTHRGPPEGVAGLLRRELDGMPLISVGVPEFQDGIGEFDDPATAERFAAALRAVSPDIVYVHSLRGLGATLLDACAAQGVPYAVMLDDVWWLCPRRIMVRVDGRDCGQIRIDLNLCRACVLTAPYLADRLSLLTERLLGAAMLLSPTRARQQLYIANGLPADRLRLLSNGVHRPSRPRGARPDDGAAIRFGYWGGTAPVDGYALLHDACEGVGRARWHLALGGGGSGNGPDERTAFLEAIDVLLFPAQGREVSGAIVREALARDVWVIATACGGAVEDVVDGVNGTIVPMDGRPDALRAAIMVLLNAPERLAGYTNPCKDQLPTLEGQTAALFTLLSEVAAPAGRG